MKKYLFIIILFVLSSGVKAQLSFNAAMGLDFRAASSFRDYINANYPSPGNLLSSFKSAASFSLETDYKIEKNFEIGLQYNLLIDSYNSTTSNYQISINYHRPSIMAYYVVPGDGYQFKFGGGLGYRYVSLTEKIYASSNYSASGFGLVLSAVGNTQLAKNVYALIGVDARYDAPGDVSSKENFNMNSISFGIYLGVTYSL